MRETLAPYVIESLDQAIPEVRVWMDSLIIWLNKSSIYFIQFGFSVTCNWSSFNIWRIKEMRARGKKRTQKEEKGSEGKRKKQWKIWQSHWNSQYGIRTQSMKPRVHCFFPCSPPFQKSVLLFISTHSYTMRTRPHKYKTYICFGWLIFGFLVVVHLRIVCIIKFPKGNTNATFNLKKYEW